MSQACQGAPLVYQTRVRLKIPGGLADKRRWYPGPPGGGWGPAPPNEESPMRRTAFLARRGSVLGVEFVNLDGPLCAPQIPGPLWTHLNSHHRMARPGPAEDHQRPVRGTLGPAQ